MFPWSVDPFRWRQLFLLNSNYFHAQNCLRFLAYVDHDGWPQASCQKWGRCCIHHHSLRFFRPLGERGRLWRVGKKAKPVGCQSLGPLLSLIFQLSTSCIVYQHWSPWFHNWKTGPHSVSKSFSYFQQFVCYQEIKWIEIDQNVLLIFNIEQFDSVAEKLSKVQFFSMVLISVSMGCGSLSRQFF